jgi:hypothetical protein
MCAQKIVSQNNVNESTSLNAFREKFGRSDFSLDQIVAIIAVDFEVILVIFELQSQNDISSGL